LFSLEKHLGGELIETPQKATKSAPEKIDLVNQQLPKPTQQNDPEPTEGEKNHKKGGLNCVFGNFFFYVLDNCPQVQSLK